MTGQLTSPANWQPQPERSTPRRGADGLSGGVGRTGRGLPHMRRPRAVPHPRPDQLRDVACPLSEVVRATPDEPAANVLPRLNACPEGRARVFADGHLAGIVSPAI
jgi:hypothetical protein